MKREDGFTLVEALIVMAVLGILAAIIVPNHIYSVKRAKEAVLKENLFQIRDAINKYYYDKKKYPTSLDDLTANRYLSKIPFDPITQSTTWKLIYFEPQTMEDYDPESTEGIVDVKSGSTETSLDGSKYSEW